MELSGSTAAIIVAAGSGSRMGADRPKQFLPLCGKPVLAHSYERLSKHPSIDPVVVVIGAGQEEEARAALGPDATLVPGGATRRESVRAGLEALAGQTGIKRVLIHDAARPLLPDAVIDRLNSALDHSKGAVPALPVVDTLSRTHDGILGDGVDREMLVRIQTPQAFDFGTILQAHRNWKDRPEPTDDATMVRAMGNEVAYVEGDRLLDKITHAEDLDRTERALPAPLLMPRIGTGYDVHRLEPGEELWLCGIRIEHDHGLSGHSDADVAIHSLVDAILGALAEGDIGSHFPPSDPQWKGAPSSAFLSFAKERVAARGGRIGHVDLTIICEAPRIGPHREAMRTELAKILGIDIGRISVKATTTERLGFTGRREGIAAHSVATLLLPDL